MSIYSRFPLHKEAKIGERNKLLELLESGIYVDSLDDNECTPLHIAAQEGNYDELILLLHFGANINSQDCQGTTPIQYAVQNLHIECIEALMNNGADITILDKRSKDVLDILQVQIIARQTDEEAQIDIIKIQKMLMKKIDPHKRAKIKKFDQQFKNKINNSSIDQNQRNIDDILGDKQQLLGNGDKISKNANIEEGRIGIKQKDKRNNSKPNKRSKLSKLLFWRKKQVNNNEDSLIEDNYGSELKDITGFDGNQENNTIDVNNEQKQQQIEKFNKDKLMKKRKQSKIKKLKFMAIKTGLMTAVVIYYCLGIFPQLVKSHPALSISLLILIFSEEFVYFLLIFAFGSGQVKITSESEMKEYLKEGDLSKVCVTCKTIRPARSKHCGQCGQCVIRFDHHCVWIATDVGRGNHRIFMPYLFNLVLNSIIGFIIFALRMKIESIFDIFSLGCCLFVMIMMGSTFAEQSWFIAHNITMNEKINQSRYEHFWRGTRFSNPFNRGVIRNIREFVLNEDVDYDSIVNGREKERKLIQDSIDKNRLAYQQQEMEQQDNSQRTQY